MENFNNAWIALYKEEVSHWRSLYEDAIKELETLKAKKSSQENGHGMRVSILYKGNKTVRLYNQNSVDSRLDSLSEDIARMVKWVALHSEEAL